MSVSQFTETTREELRFGGLADHEIIQLEEKLLTLNLDFDFSKVSVVLNAKPQPSQCFRKVRYGHRETAIKAAEAMKAKTGDSFDSYSCDLCKGWHIGHSR